MVQSLVTFLAAAFGEALVAFIAGFFGVLGVLSGVFLVMSVEDKQKGVVHPGYNRPAVVSPAPLEMKPRPRPAKPKPVLTTEVDQNGVAGKSTLSREVE